MTIAGSFGYGWLRRVTGWGLVDVPNAPWEDRWLQEHRVEFEQHGAEHLFTVLVSLWKAAFADGDAAAQLRADAFNMDAIGQTKLGDKGLREVLGDARDHRLTTITMGG